MAEQPQGAAPAALSQAHTGKEPQQQPEPQPKSDHETPSQPQPQSQTESQQVTQEAHTAREIARPDARPIASDIADIEGHAPREAAHLSSPPALNRFQIVEQIAREARAQLRPGHTELTVRLDPPSLGTVHMRVVSQGAALTAHLEASAEASRDLINANLPALKDALADAGITVSQFSVTVGGGQRQDGAHGQALHPQWHPTPVATDEQTDDVEIATVAALKAWGYGGGRHFDAFA